MTELYAPSPIGLSENPMFAWNRWDDVVCQVTEHLTINMASFVRVRGHFWQPDLELRFYIAGHSHKASERYFRDLNTALTESPKLKDALFGELEKVFPAHWFAPCQPKPGLSKLEKAYRRYLPEKFKGPGIPI